MAKNLQNILNEVVGEILQENGEHIVVGGEPAAPSTARVLVTRGMSPDRQDEANRVFADRDAKLRASAEDNTPLKQKIAFGEDPATGASLPTVDPVSTSDRVGSYFTGLKDSALNKYYTTKNDIGEWYNDLDPNTQTAIKYGVPIGATALAAGAGALYLRKKQREANRAAGVR